MAEFMVQIPIFDTGDILLSCGQNSYSGNLYMLVKNIYIMAALNQELLQLSFFSS